MLTHLTHMYPTHLSREAWSHPVHALGIELRLSLLLAQVQGHVEGLGDEDAAINLCHCLCGLLWGAEADKPKALGGSPLVTHDLKGRRGGNTAGFCWRRSLLKGVLLSPILSY